MSLSAHRPQQLLCSRHQDGPALFELWLVGGRGSQPDPLRVDLLGDLDRDGGDAVVQALESLLDSHAPDLAPHLELRVDAGSAVEPDAMAQLWALQARLVERAGQLAIDLGTTTLAAPLAADRHQPQELLITTMSPEPIEQTIDGTSTVDVDRAHEDGVLALLLHGELDSDNAASLADALRGGAEGHDGPVVLDMTDVSFIDSTILSRLLQFHAEREDAGSAVTMRRVSPMVLRVLQITGLDGVFGLQ